MRIALVVDRFDPLAGGLEQWTVALARFLVARGHDVHVVTFAEANHDLAVTAHVLLPPAGHLARARHVADAVSRLGAAVVHDTGFGWSGDVFHPQTGSRLLSQARLVATHPLPRRVRAAISPVSIAWRWQMARLERQQVQRARKVIAVSRLVRDQLAARHAMATEDVIVIPNGAETARFAPERIAPWRDETRARFALGAATVLLASARNAHLKGVDIAMRALARLVTDGADARLLVAGTAADASWQNLAARLGVAGRVHFAGPVTDMEAMFAAADILVHPTRWDACSLSTIEAAAAGLPVITTAMNGAAELITHGRTGFVLPDPEDADALAACLRPLLDAGFRQRIGAAAHLAAQHHDIGDNLRAVEAVLIETAAQRGRS